MFLVLLIVLGMIPAAALATEIPDGAPFTAVAADVEGAVTITDKGTVKYFDGTSMVSYSDVPYYHVTVPAGTTKVDVTYTDEAYPNVNDEMTIVYAHYADPNNNWSGKSTYLSNCISEDGYTITIPMSTVIKDSMTWADVTLDFVTSVEGYKAFSIQESAQAPTAFFTFEYAGEDSGETECAHAWGDGEVTTDPTCEGTGIRTYTCSLCGETKTEEEAATGHAWGEGAVTTEPTCEGAGVRTFTCGNCGGTKTEEEAALGHNYVDGVCTNCSEADPDYDQGDEVISIGTADELMAFAERVNGGETDLCAVLTADIDLSSKNWTSIGTSVNSFAGTFDGQKHTVFNLTGANGLFGYAAGTADAYAEIKNVTVDGTITAQATYTAGVVGNASYVTVENCINRASISTTYDYAGGIVGKISNGGTIIGCGNEAIINGGGYVGGIVGLNWCGTIKNCWNIANIAASGNYVGGIVGNNHNTNAAVTGCYNKGTIIAAEKVGGIAGYNSKSVSDCYNWGAVIGVKDVGGIVGNVGMCFNTIINSYNAGFVFGKTNAGSLNGYSMTGAAANNCYYLKGTADTTADVATVKTAEELKSTEMVTALGDSYKQGSLYPILSWQEDDNVSAYDVTIPVSETYEVIASELAFAGEDYHFFMTYSEGYIEGDDFAITVNDEVITAVNGYYTIENVAEDLEITVAGVELELTHSFDVTVSTLGNGCKITPVEGCEENTVIANTDYKFTISFVDGFQTSEDLTVKANDVELTADENGVYTISAVTEDQVIEITGVALVPYEDTVSVNITVTYGENKFYIPENHTDFVMLKDMEIPYFDLSLYGLERYYYNPDCYASWQQPVGTPEMAYGKVTLMHAYIYLTEVYYLGMDPADAGKGISYQEGIFEDAISWGGKVGSSFMELWDHGTNLNYYVNYEYPLGAPMWGSTSDQIILNDGDIISIHLIQDTDVSGSNFSVFTVNDEDNAFTQDEVTDTITVTQGDEVTLTLYWSGANSDYTTKFDPIPNWTLYWIDENNLSNDVSAWNTTAFANYEAGALATDSNGDIAIDTTDLEPGTYYIGSIGGLTAGGQEDSAGFVSRGGETGAGVFKLVVEAAPYKAKIGDTEYDSLAEALAAAVSGDVVVLGADAEEGTVILAPGVTLDLGEYNLTADYFVGLKGSALTAVTTTNTVAGGKLIVDKDSLVLPEAPYVNTAATETSATIYVIPVWDDIQECYVFSRIRANHRAFTISDDTLYYEFGHTAENYSNKTLWIDGSSDNYVSVEIQLKWETVNAQTGTTNTAYQNYVYSDSSVAKVSGGGYVYTFTLTGLSNLGITDVTNLTVTPVFRTESGTVATGTTYYGSQAGTTAE